MGSIFTKKGRWIFNKAIDHYGATRECASLDCEGCPKCYRVKQLIEEVRSGNTEAAMELANRVEQLMGSGDFKPGTAGWLVRSKIEPIGAHILDALEAACSMHD